MPTFQFMRLVKYLWILSLLVYLGLTLYMYIYLPKNIRIPQAEGADYLFTKSTFFYAAIGIMILFNVVLNAIGSVLPFLPRSFVIVPSKQKWLKSIKTREMLNLRTKGWSRGMALIINMLLLALTASILGQSQAVLPDFTYLIYFLILLVFFWLVYFYFLTRQLPEEVQ